MSGITDKKIRTRARDFIGQTFNNGNLEVVSIDSVDASGKTRFKVICKICSQDPELFPDGYFICYKDFLTNGSIPCGCSKQPKWEDWQYMVKAKRVADERGYIVHGFAEKYKNCYTKLDVECLKDGHRWTPTINNFIKHRRGCPKCSKSLKLTTSEAEKLCVERCKELNYTPIGFNQGHKSIYSKFTFICPNHGEYAMSFQTLVQRKMKCRQCGLKEGAEKQRLPEDQAIKNATDACSGTKYTFLGFPNGYTTNVSDLEYLCPEHGIKRMRYYNFMNGRRCKECAMLTTSANGYYEHRKDEQDFLYVLNFNDKYIKVGRTFKFDSRLGQLKSKSNCENVTLVAMVTGKHKPIWDLEQSIHKQLRLGRLDLIPDNWYSQETFKVDSLSRVLETLEECGFEQVY